MSQQAKVRLLIADDHEMIRSGVKGLLADTEIKVIAEADNCLLVYYRRGQGGQKKDGESKDVGDGRGGGGRNAGPGRAGEARATTVCGRKLAGVC